LEKTESSVGMIPVLDFKDTSTVMSKFPIPDASSCKHRHL
jgi:hypothetical protein